MKNKIKDHLLAAHNALTRLQRQLVERDFCWGIKIKQKRMMRHSQKGITEDQFYTEACDNQLFRNMVLNYLSLWVYKPLTVLVLVTVIQRYVRVSLEATREH